MYHTETIGVELFVLASYQGTPVHYPGPAHTEICLRSVMHNLRTLTHGWLRIMLTKNARLQNGLNEKVGNIINNFIFIMLPPLSHHIQKENSLHLTNNVRNAQTLKTLLLWLSWLIFVHFYIYAANIILVPWASQIPHWNIQLLLRDIWTQTLLSIIGPQVLFVYCLLILLGSWYLISPLWKPFIPLYLTE